jgi:hypothetical protein
MEPFNTWMGGLTPAEYAALTPQVGSNWFPGSTPVVVDYPASLGFLWGKGAPQANESIDIGQASLHSAIMKETAGGDPVVVAALSMGTFVVDQELAYLAGAPDAPPADELNFVVFASPNRGVAGLFPIGFTIPIVGFTARAVPVSQYHVDAVFKQYDAWADFPDRPWNLIATANVLMGMRTRPDLHTPAALLAPSETVLISSTVNPLGGTVNTYMVPTPDLPLTDPLRRVGVPEKLVDRIDNALRPIVAAGYSRNDLGTTHKPYLSHGHIVWPGRAVPAAAITGAPRASLTARATASTINRHANIRPPTPRRSA